MSALADVLIASLTLRDEAFDAFTRGLTAEERASLLSELCARAGRPDGSSAALLRPLLRGAPLLRLQAARKVVRLMREEVLSGKSAFLCLTELRVAVIRHWEGRCVPHLLADSGRTEVPSSRQEVQDVTLLPASQRLDELLLLCNDVLLVLLPPSTRTSIDDALPLQRLSGRSSAAHASAEGWGDGCAAVVQLLPTLLRAADSAHKELQPTHRGTDAVGRAAAGTTVLETAAGSGAGTDESDESGEGEAHVATALGGDAPPSAPVVTRLLASRWDPRAVLPILAALEDITLSAEHLASLQRRLRSLLWPSSVALIRPHLLGIGKHILARADDGASGAAPPPSRANAQPGALPRNRAVGGDAGYARCGGAVQLPTAFDSFYAQCRALAAQVALDQPAGASGGGRDGSASGAGVDDGGSGGGSGHETLCAWCELLQTLAGVMSSAELPVRHSLESITPSKRPPAHCMHP